MKPCSEVLRREHAEPSSRIETQYRFSYRKSQPMWIFDLQSAASWPLTKPLRHYDSTREFMRLTPGSFAPEQVEALKWRLDLRDC